jgi:hypothetical protein
MITSGGGTVEYRVFVNMFGHRELVITSENAEQTKGIINNLVDSYKINPMSISVREYDRRGNFRSKKCGRDFLN